MGPFNEQMKEKLKQYLLAEFKGPMPIGSNAIASAGIDRLKDLVVSDGPGPTPPSPMGIDDLPPPAQDMTLADANKLAGGMPKPPMPAQPNSLRTVEATPAPAQQAIQTSALQQPTMGSQYDDNARQQLYAKLAAQRKEGGAYAAAAGLGDMARRMGGSTGINAQEKLQEQVNLADKTGREEFDAARKGQIEDVSTGLALKKAGREETEYKDQNDPASQQSKLAVALALKYAPDQAKQMGWAAGKSTYADVIKVLPIMEKINASEQAHADRASRNSDKDSLAKDKMITGWRNTIQTSDPYKTMSTLRNVRAAAVQAERNPTPFGDVQLIYAAVKAFDPNSVVREGEIKLFQGASSVKTQLQAALATAFAGQTLTPDQRKNIMAVLDNYEKTAAAVLNNHIEPTRQQATRMGARMEEIDPLLAQFDPKAGGVAQPAPSLNPASAKRLAELRAKRDAGTLQR